MEAFLMSNSAIPGFNVGSPGAGNLGATEFNENPARLSACALIAAKINAELQGRGAVTAEQVLAIADGRERSDSHPVLARIRRECEAENLILPPQPK